VPNAIQWRRATGSLRAHDRIEHRVAQRRDEVIVVDVRAALVGESGP
jgi:hypothetical protein